MALYHALIGDIRRSRLLEDRAARQHTLQGLLEQAGETFHEQVLSRFAFTGGDEFKALFATGEGAFRCAVWIARRSDLELRFGLGRGPLEVGEPGDPPGGLDGPCFHHARNAVEEARRGDHWMAVHGYASKGWESFDSLMNATLALLGRVRSDWTPRQKEYITLLESGMSQKAAAASLGVSPPAVSEAVKSAKWHEVRAIEQEIAKTLASREGRS